MCAAYFHILSQIKFFIESHTFLSNMNVSRERLENTKTCSISTQGFKKIEIKVFYQTELETHQNNYF